MELQIQTNGAINFRVPRLLIGKILNCMSKPGSNEPPPPPDDDDNDGI